MNNESVFGKVPRFSRYSWSACVSKSTCRTESTWIYLLVERRFLSPGRYTNVKPHTHARYASFLFSFVFPVNQLTRNDTWPCWNCFYMPFEQEWIKQKTRFLYQRNWTNSIQLEKIFVQLSDSFPIIQILFRYHKFMFIINQYISLFLDVLQYKWYECI